VSGKNTYARTIGAGRDLQTPSSAVNSIKENIRPSKEVAAMLMRSAWVCFEQQQYNEAADLLKQALSTREQSLGKTHRKLLPILNGLGMVYCEMGRYDRSEEAFVRALEIAELHPRASKVREIEILENFEKLLRKTGFDSDADQIKKTVDEAKKQESKIPAAMKLARHLTSSRAIDGVRFAELLSEPVATQAQKATLPWGRLALIAVLIAILFWLLFFLK